MTAPTTCRHCGRRIVNDNEKGWIDPEANGDDAIWRETCDAHDTMEAEHQPELTRETAIAQLEEVAGGLNDGHARWPVPELGDVIEWLKRDASSADPSAPRADARPWKIGDPDPRPYIWIKVEGGLADYGGDIDRVDVGMVDFDISEHAEAAIEELDDMLLKAEGIPDRLAELPHDDPRWLDKAGIIQTLREDLAEALQRDAGEEVFVTDDGIVPRCDICDDPQLAAGDDWDGDTGEHRSCQTPAARAAADRRIINDLKEMQA